MPSSRDIAQRYEQFDFVRVYDASFGKRHPMTIQAELSETPGESGAKLAVINILHDTGPDEWATNLSTTSRSISYNSIADSLEDRGIKVVDVNDHSTIYHTPRHAYMHVYRLYLEVPASMTPTSFHELTMLCLQEAEQTNQGFRSLVKGGLFGRAKVADAPSRPTGPDRPERLFRMYPEGTFYCDDPP